MPNVLGNIYSIEPANSTSGPGTRFVVSLQGCTMRCLYCCVPESRDFNINKKMTVEEILEKYDKVKDHLKNGGLTLSGGEPLAQLGFAIELFKQAKEKEIHTALDTSGILFNSENIIKINTLLQYTDLVILDIKHIDSNEHNKLTGHPNSNVLSFARYLSDKNIPVWIRHVLIPNITANKTLLMRLGEFLAALKNIQAIDIIPYQSIDSTKYEKLNIPCPLKDIPSMPKESLNMAKNTIIEAMRSTAKRV